MVVSAGTMAISVRRGCRWPIALAILADQYQFLRDATVGIQKHPTTIAYRLHQIMPTMAPKPDGKGARSANHCLP